MTSFWPHHETHTHSGRQVRPCEGKSRILSLDAHDTYGWVMSRAAATLPSPYEVLFCQLDFLTNQHHILYLRCLFHVVDIAEPDQPKQDNTLQNAHVEQKTAGLLIDVESSRHTAKQSMWPIAL
eukprot:4331846-Amphidinium_carterae.1